MAKRISIILLSTSSVLLNSIITIHVLRSSWQPLLLTTAKQKGSKWLFWSMCALGKGFLAPLFSQLPSLIMGHTLGRTYQLVSQITYALRQLNKKCKRSSRGCYLQSMQQQITDSTGAKYGRHNGGKA